MSLSVRKLRHLWRKRKVTTQQVLSSLKLPSYHLSLVTAGIVLVVLALLAATALSATYFVYKRRHTQQPKLATQIISRPMQGRSVYKYLLKPQLVNMRRLKMDTSVQLSLAVVFVSVLEMCQVW